MLLISARNCDPASLVPLFLPFISNLRVKRVARGRESTFVFCFEGHKKCQEAARPAVS